MALDSVHHRVFVPASGNGGFRVFQLDENGFPLEPGARHIIGRPSIFGRRNSPLPSRKEMGFPGTWGIVDNTSQRLFAVDQFNNRILVFDVDPDRLKDFPDALVVIGQPDFTSTQRALGPNRFRGLAGVALDEENQRLFASDGGGNRILVFDIAPERLHSDPSAFAVLGQPDFMSGSPGAGPNRLAFNGSVAFDPVNQRLFVKDFGNSRVLVFDVAPERLANGAPAVAVLGQPDFMSRTPQRDPKKLGRFFIVDGIALDWMHQRLFIAKTLENRVMVFDVAPGRLESDSNPDAIAVIGQPDFQTFAPNVSRTRITMPRVTVDSRRQKLYVSEGFPGGNRVDIFDISPGNLVTGMPAVGVIGHFDEAGNPDFNQRMAQGRLTPRSLAAERAVTLDPVDHRLFVPDEYNHRVVVWQLDEQNRVLDYDADWVLGQPDLRSGFSRPPSATTMKVPLASAYDTRTKRLYVGDGYNNRVLVFDAAPGRLRSGAAAIAVLGQPDFTTVAPATTQSGFNFDVRFGRGIASSFLPVGVAVDEENQRLFVSDGLNNRVMVFDVTEVQNGEPAIAVLGQPDFTSNDAATSQSGLRDPGHLAYDSAHQRLFVADSNNNRVLVFDVPPGFENGKSASVVLGQPDFATRDPAPKPSANSIVAPNGVAYDSRNDRLFVTDRSRDRVLIFDAAPANLTSGVAAVGIIGRETLDTVAPRAFGGAMSDPGQFTFRDPRGIAYDSTYGRLYVTDSFSSRLLIFNFPRSSWNFAVEASGVQTFSSLDAIDLGLRQQAREVGYARIASEGEAAPGGMAILSHTQTLVDPVTERHSRLLISEAALSATSLMTSAVVYAEPGRETLVSVVNPAQQEVALRFTLRDQQGRILQKTTRRLAPATRRAAVYKMSDLLALGEHEVMGTVVIESDVPVALSALSSRMNERGETILSPVPISRLSDQAPPVQVFLPRLRNGDGYRTQVVLLNPWQQSVRGAVTFFDQDGIWADVGGGAERRYEIAPGGAWVVETDENAPFRSGYAVITPDHSPAPLAHTRVSLRHRGILISEAVFAAALTQQAWAPVDTRPTLIRHGEIDARVILVNPEPRPATIQVGLFDRQGQQIDGAGLVLSSFQQLDVSLTNLLSRDVVNGAVRITSDAPVAVAVEQDTTNLRDEVIQVSLPVIESRGNGPAIFPQYINGEGIATQFILINPGSEKTTGTVDFFSPAGEPMKVILR